MSAHHRSPYAKSNYFICTLGEAVGKSLSHSNLQTINDFIDHQAISYPKNFAAGFPIPGGETDSWKYELFTFEDLRHGSLAIAGEIASILPPRIGGMDPQVCVALLCPSSIDFLFAWLGLMRAGLSVLLIAPQCQPAAIAHLCKSCDVAILFYDESFTELAFKSVSQSETRLLAVELPWQAQKISVTSMMRGAKRAPNIPSNVNKNASDAAYIFHTSGTSTGLPKPIVQSHHAAFGVLPTYDGQQSACFTTTPLYHGGIADCFRAWTSRALIWLFPAANMPITTQNIRSCLLVAGKATSESSAAQVKYFSSVPYVLQMLIEDQSGLRILQSMDIVGVGGAALSPKVGDELVKEGVNLVSRFGSAECGFLLASHRDYNADKDWQYLRVSPESELLCFEEIDDGSGLSELVVKKGWPHMAKTNRKDGSFATCDLFEPHETIKGAWRYRGRSDSQITLNTGKKFDPAPLEDSITASCSYIKEVLIFGSERLNPGILVFPSKKSVSLSDSSLEEEIWGSIQVINSKGQDHTRILRDKLVIMSVQQPELERSSKGTLFRGTMEKKFAKDIEWAYTKDSVPVGEVDELQIGDGDVKTMVRRTITQAVGVDCILNDDTDFYGYGIDSAACTRIRSLLQKNLFQGRIPLPWSVVYDCGNINRLSQFITDIMDGKPMSHVDEETEMIELVNKFSELNNENCIGKGKKKADNAQHVVLLTGATGALGAHLLDTLRKSPSTFQIICLVRAVDHYSARSRVSASLVKRKKQSLEISDPKVWCSPCKLNDPNLGLSEIELLHIRENATHIIHAAWAVNFSIPLRSFVDEHITGLHNLLNLSASCLNAIHFTFCSSTASVLGPNQPAVIEEHISSTCSDAGLIGYSRSKWVAEAVCAAAATTLAGTVTILRIGQLTGDTNDGVWNISEAWPLMLTTVDALGCLPQIEEPLSWLPLDVAATAVVEISTQNRGVQNGQQIQVYHLVNNSRDTTWSDLLSWTKRTRKEPFDIVSPTVWLDKLENYPKKHPAKNLLGLWRNTYGHNDKDKEQGTKHEKTIFSIVEAQKSSAAMRTVLPVDEDLVKKIWSWLEEEIKAAKTQVYVSRNRFNDV